ncbi:MAG: hypothetical protein EPN17_17255 [Methylobacter sp.]|nr:MAG: hypothetical protein EPN17_17255 [Methylobacter sp.]
MLTNLIIFFFYLVAVVYCAGFALTNSSTQVRAKEVYMYSGTLALIGCISEVAINSFCRAAFDSSLWVYQVTPIHHGDTSIFAFFQWSLYGYHLYFVHQKIQSLDVKYKEYIFTVFLAVEALLLEILVNVSSNFFLNTFIFYYLPGDMGHLTTVFVFPFYLLGGAILIGIFSRFLKDPMFFGTLSFSVAFIFVFLS